MSAQVVGCGIGNLNLTNQCSGRLVASKTVPLKASAHFSGGPTMRLDATKESYARESDTATASTPMPKAIDMKANFEMTH